MPGTIGTPASDIIFLAPVFEPISTICCADGPINTTPAFSHSFTKSAFSDKKPYPGWIAAPVFLAISNIFSGFK